MKHESTAVCNFADDTVLLADSQLTREVKTAGKEILEGV